MTNRKLHTSLALVQARATRTDQVSIQYLIHQVPSH